MTAHYPEEHREPDPKHWCTTCAIPHVDNCPDCYGFGLYAGGVPVSAREACDMALRGPTERCPTCGGHVRLITTATLLEKAAMQDSVRRSLDATFGNTEPRL